MKHFRIWDAVSHATIILAVMFIVFFVIDQINPAMEFIASDLSKWVLLLFALCALSCGVMSAISMHLRKKAEYDRAAAKAALNSEDKAPEISESPQQGGKQA